MESGISKDEIVAKLKDDGDFDRLRLKIIRQLKDNEELRNNIISTVKQSAALNRAGAENMKPRQLSDAIHEEVGNKIMSRISDGVWEIIRSDDGMKSEITETVQSIYKKLLNPKGQEEGESSFHSDVMPVQKEADDNGSLTVSASEIDDTLSDSEPKEPPGFSLRDHNQSNCEEQPKGELQLLIPHERGPAEEQKEEPQDSQNVLEPGDTHFSVPPGLSSVEEHKQLCDDSDEDLDVPPGFG